MKKFKSEIGLEFKGAVKWGKVFRYAVFADLFDEESGEIVGGTRIANFNKKKFARMCCDQINKINPRFNAHVFKMPLLRRVTLKFYAIRKKI
ncbi:MAG: hypothetical protein WAV31_06535 [Candidatus Moraniibacteriota bacterium]